MPLPRCRLEDLAPDGLSCSAVLLPMVVRYVNVSARALNMYGSSGMHTTLKPTACQRAIFQRIAEKTCDMFARLDAATARLAVSAAAGCSAQLPARRRLHWQRGNALHDDNHVVQCTGCIPAPVVLHPGVG